MSTLDSVRVCLARVWPVVPWAAVEERLRKAWVGVRVDVLPSMGQPGGIGTITDVSWCGGTTLAVALIRYDDGRRMWHSRDLLRWLPR